MKENILTSVKEYLILALACFIFAIAWESFMIPNGMSAGGLMGLSTVIQYATGGIVPAQYTYIGINAMLIIVAVLAMGIGFGFKTIFCIAMSSLAMELLDGVQAIQCIPGEFLYIRENVLIPVIAGVFEAVGIGLVLRYGGSTGGTDIVALMVNRYWPISLSTAFLVSDLIVCSLLLLLPDKSFADMIYGIEELVTFSLMIDFVVGGKKSSYQLLVFSQRHEQIADHIINNMDRGVTVLHATGWYTRQDRDVLLIIISQKQLPELTRAIKEIDDRAFMSISPTNSVYGEGFDEIKAGVSIKRKKRSGNDDESK